MDFIELSIAELKTSTSSLLSIVSQSYTPDAIAYIAKGGYLIGKSAGQYFDVPLIELLSCRSGDKYKQDKASLLKLLPKAIRKKLRSIEIRYRLSQFSRNDEQETQMVISNESSLPANIERILLLDDSLDTGVSLNTAKKILVNIYPGATIKTAVLNSFQQDNPLLAADYVLHTDTLLSTPASKDSKEYDTFCQMYEHHVESASIQ